MCWLGSLGLAGTDAIAGLDLSELKCSGYVATQSALSPRHPTVRSHLRCASSLLRVTQDEHGDDVHGEHVEPDIPGA
jgi:hypothetical protein